VAPVKLAAGPPAYARAPGGASARAFPGARR
jgi:hypothetical protein